MSAEQEQEQEQQELDTDLLDSVFPDEASKPESEAKAEDADASEDTEEKGIEPPEHWSDADKEVFNAVDPDAQEWLMGRYKSIEGDAENKWQEASVLRRENEKLFSFAENAREITAQVVDAYKRNGKSELDALREMAAWFNAAMSPDPEIRKQIARQYISRANIDPSDLFPGNDDELADPQVKQLQRELAEMRNHLNQTAQQQNVVRQQGEQHRMRTVQETAQKEYADFSAEKDDEGNLKHPHLSDEKVQKLIGSLLADPSIELEDAYQTAAQHYGLSQESPAARIRRARKAASGVRSKGESVENLSNLSTAEIASKAWDQSVGKK